MSITSFFSSLFKDPRHDLVIKLKADAEAGDAKAQYDLAMHYAENERGPINEANASFWLEKSANQGYAPAQHILGAMTVLGLGFDNNIYDTRKNVELGVSLLRKAAEQGYARAQGTLGDIYTKGLGVPKDATEGVRWYQKAAGQGDVEAQYALGWCLEIGEGIQQDDTKADYWFRQAAQQGHKEAKKMVGFWK